MGTIVGVETEDGAVLAADRIHVDESSGVKQTLDRTFEYGYAAAAAVGDAAGIEAFGRELEAELDDYRAGRNVDPRIDALAEAAGRVASAANVEAIVLGRDDEDRARIRAVRSDGATFDDDRSAFGSGAPLALGRLEGADLGEDLDETEALLREVVSSVAERDAGTGAEVRTVRRANDKNW